MTARLAHRASLIAVCGLVAGGCVAGVSPDDPEAQEEPKGGGGGGGSGGAGGAAGAGGAPGAGGSAGSRDGGPGAPPANLACDPSGGGPYWIEEGATVTATIKCRTGRALAGDAFVLTGLPPGAVYDRATAQVSWKTALDSAGVYVIGISAQPYNDAGELKIGVADKFDDPGNVAIKDPVAYSEEFGLPVMHLQTTADIDKNLAALQARQGRLWQDPCNPLCGPSLYSPVTIIYRGHIFKAEGHYRGASSLGYPKKNYTLRFPKEDKFSELLMTGGRMRQRRRIALITTFDDNSYVRWRLAFELWNRLDPNIIRIEHFSAVVYLNGKYLGLYAVSDKIDNNMMERAGLAELGNLYMGIDHNANFDTLARQQSGATAGMVRPRNCPYEGFTKKEGLPEECNGTLFVREAYNDLASFYDFVSKTDDVTFRAEVGQKVEVKDYINWWVHSTAIIANDSYAKNGLHYHNPAGGPWRVVVWDYNASFGQTWNTVRTTPMVDSPAGVANSTSMPARNNLWKRLWNHPTFGAQMKARYAAALKNELKIEDVLAAYDAMVKETDAGARRDERKWAAMYRAYYGPTSGTKRMDITDYGQEIAYTRQWLMNRWAYLKTQFP